MTLNETLLSRIDDSQATIAVIGLGYVGLPLALACARAGYTTVGIDTDKTKVEGVNQGLSHIGDVCTEDLASAVTTGGLRAESSYARLPKCDVIVICVPTPLNKTKDPDLSIVVGAMKQISRVLRPGQLVVLESTTYPTTTRSVVLPLLAESGLALGSDYFLAYSPEREDPGNPDYTAAGIPKVVGGIDEPSNLLATALYEQAIVQVIPVGSPEVAEACKILENTYRAVNIALVNELKMLLDRMDIDVWDVIDAASTKPFGFQAFYPGPGLGGHCIPIDPFYLTWLARKQGLSTRFIELAGEINSQMPEYVISRLMEFLNETSQALRGSRICLLGMAYKKDVDDPRESPSFVLMDLLRQRGVELSYNDPHIPVLPRMRHHDVPDLSSTELTAEFLESQDCVLIATDHSAYDYDFIVKHARLVIDTRNATAQVTEGREKIRKC